MFVTLVGTSLVVDWRGNSGALPGAAAALAEVRRIARAEDPRDYADPTWDPAERQPVVTYLEHCYSLGYMNPTAAIWCPFGCRDPSPRGGETLTDGSWEFPEILIHYVRDHAVKPPDEFLAHVRSTASKSQDLWTEEKLVKGAALARA